MTEAGAHTEYAPASVLGVLERLRELRPRHVWELGGIVGDAAHTYGYHRARAVLPPNDYSVVLPRDRQGPSWAASALDITPEETDRVRHLTQRLIRAVQAGDPRLRRTVREFYGTVDGVHVFGWDLHTGNPQQADDTHLWHLHLSFYRKNLDRADLLRPVGDILAGH